MVALPMHSIISLSNKSRECTQLELIVSRLAAFPQFRVSQQETIPTKERWGEVLCPVAESKFPFWDCTSIHSSAILVFSGHPGHRQREVDDWQLLSLRLSHMGVLPLPSVLPDFEPPVADCMSLSETVQHAEPKWSEHTTTPGRYMPGPHPRAAHHLPRFECEYFISINNSKNFHLSWCGDSNASNSIRCHTHTQTETHPGLPHHLPKCFFPRAFRCPTPNATSRGTSRDTH